MAQSGIHVEATPAYGRDYKNQAAVKQDWKDGKDFILQDFSSRWDQKPFNIDTAKQMGWHVLIRYSKLSKVVDVTSK